MQVQGGRSWSAYIGIGVLVLFSPVLLVAAWSVLGPHARPTSLPGFARCSPAATWCRWRDGWDTTVALALLLVVLGGLGLLLRPFDRRRGQRLVAALFRSRPTLAAGVEYGLGALLTSRGYGYCTFHVTSKDRGEGGTYVYVRAGLPEACDAVQRIFPPHRLVPGRRDSFDLPPS